jgi:hypothetical protein
MASEMNRPSSSPPVHHALYGAAWTPPRRNGRGNERTHAGDGRRLGQILSEIAGRPDPRLTLGELIDSMGDRSHGLLVAALALPNALPIYLPGLSAVFGLPLVFLALQLAIARDRLWLPKSLMRRSLSRALFARMARSLVPYLARLERALKPRMTELISPAMERTIGVLSVFLGLLLSLPIPLTNIPLTIPLVVLGVGLAERDGLMVAVGLVLGVLVAATVLTLSGTLIFAMFAWIAALL